MKGYKHLTEFDRNKIARMRKEGATMREIGAALHVSAATVCREIKRGTYTYMNADYIEVTEYIPERSQARYRANMAAKGGPLKIGSDRRYAETLEALIADDNYSPEAALHEIDFNPRAPCGARQQKYTKLLYTLLRQKAILRQFHAKRRLLKRFSTYKYRNTFLICSANRMGKICTLPLRTTRSLDLPESMFACSQSARFCFRTFPGSKNADYPAPDP